MTPSFSSPTVEPLNLQEAKNHLRITGTTEDSLIETLIGAAWRDVSEYTGRSLIQRTVTLDVDRHEVRGHDLWLPYGPVSSITSVTTYDANGTGTTVTSTNYYLDGDNLVGQNSGYLGSIGRQYKALRIVYVAGYGTTPTAIPELLRLAILMRLADLYEVRQSETTGTVVVGFKTNWQSVASSFRQIAIA